MQKIFFSLIVVFVMTACAISKKSHTLSSGGVAYYALAVIRPTQDHKAAGTVWVSEGFGQVTIEAQITGLDANSKHGIHIHEFGDCSALDGASAGGHFNPTEADHGGPDSDKKHVGDLGNLETNKKGEATFKLVLKGLSINSGLNPILGRSIVIHKNGDDLISQPNGGSGPRVGCGVIGAATRK